jgi:ADP-ribose pyrophosphatase YjhB (NUDIX family)
MTRVDALVALLSAHVCADDRENADRNAMLRLARELDDPLSRTQPHAHFTASAFVVDPGCDRTCLVRHEKLGRLLQPGGHIDDSDASVEAAAYREAREETELALEPHPRAPRPFDIDIHQIPPLGGEPAHLHLDVRFLVVGRGEPCDGAGWYELGSAGDGSVVRLAERARTYR